jgi:hypothetical protein
LLVLGFEKLHLLQQVRGASFAAKLLAAATGFHDTREPLAVFPF